MTSRSRRGHATAGSSPRPGASAALQPLKVPQQRRGTAARSSMSGPSDSGTARATVGGTDLATSSRGRSSWRFIARGTTQCVDLLFDFDEGPDIDDRAAVPLRCCGTFSGWSAAEAPGLGDDPAVACPRLERLVIQQRFQLPAPKPARQHDTDVGSAQLLRAAVGEAALPDLGDIV